MQYRTEVYTIHSKSGQWTASWKYKIIDANKHGQNQLQKIVLLQVMLFSLFQL
jgi:hypothetical protein